MRFKSLKFLLLASFLTGSGLVFSPRVPAQTSPPAGSPTDVPGEYAAFQPEGDIRRFIGETLLIDIGFLWFENAAVARVGLYEKDGVVYSTLEAETKGFVGFFTAYRKHFYQSTFDIVDDGKRVRSKKFERKVIIGNQVDKTTHSFDYSTRIHKWHREIDGKVIEEESDVIPWGINFDDILAVFYNFRNGVYGKVVKGARYTVHTVPEEGVDKIWIHIMNPEQQTEFMSQEGRGNGEEFLLKAIIPKAIFNTATGELLFWSSRHLVPLETTVKDYILFGDLHAKLNRREFRDPTRTIPSFRRFLDPR